MPDPTLENQAAHDAAALPMAMPDSEPLPIGPGMTAPATAAASAAARASAPRRRLDALRGLFFGPVFLRDLRVASRSRGTYVTRSMIVAVLLAVLVIAYSAVFSGDSGSSAAAQFQRLQVIAPTLTLSMVWFYFLVFPILAASGIGGIASEHARGTLSAIASTPMSPASIVLSTFSGRMVQIALLFGLTLPAIIIISGYGGIDLPALLAAAMVILCTIILAGSYASLGAVVGKKPSSAASMGIGLLILMNAYPMLLAATAGILGMQPSAWWEHTLYGSPLMAMVSIPGLTGRGFGSLPPVYFAFIYSVIALACSAGALAISFAVWRSRMRQAMAGAPVLTRKAKRAARKLAAEQAIASSQASLSPAMAGTIDVLGSTVPVAVDAPRLASGSRTVGDRPVLWHELQQLRPFRGARNIVVCTLPLLGLGIMYYNFSPSTEGCLYAVTGIASSFAVLIGLGSAANSLSTEIHRRTLPLLLTTRQSVRQLLWEKFIAAWLRPWPLAFALALHCVIAWMFGGPSVLAAIPLLLVLVAGVAMTASASLLGAVLMRKAGGATGFALLLLSTIWVLPWIGLGSLYLVLQIGRFPQNFAPDVIMLVNPMVINGITAAGFEGRMLGEYQSIEFAMPTYGRISVYTWLLIQAGFLLFATIWTWGCLSLAERRFARSVLPRLI